MTGNFHFIPIPAKSSYSLKCYFWFYLVLYFSFCPGKFLKQGLVCRVSSLNGYRFPLQLCLEQRNLTLTSGFRLTGVSSSPTSAQFTSFRCQGPMVEKKERQSVHQYCLPLSPAPFNSIICLSWYCRVVIKRSKIELVCTRMNLTANKLTL